MIVIHRPLRDGEVRRVEYKITKNDTRLMLNFKGETNGYEYDKTVELLFDEYAGKVINLSLQWTNQLELRISPMYEMVSRYYAASEQQNEAYGLCRVSISPDHNDIVIFLNWDTDYECPDAENVEIPDHYTKTQIMQQYSPFYKERCEYIHKKVTMMRSVDIYNTVTYLESQIDALTRLFIKTLPDNDTSKEGNILKEADKHSVLDVKNIDKIMEELKTDKQLVRDLQKEYYSDES